MALGRVATICFACVLAIHMSENMCGVSDAVPAKPKATNLISLEGLNTLIKRLTIKGARHNYRLLISNTESRQDIQTTTLRVTKGRPATISSPRTVEAYMSSAISYTNTLQPTDITATSGDFTGGPSTNELPSEDPFLTSEESVLNTGSTQDVSNTWTPVTITYPNPPMMSESPSATSGEGISAGEGTEITRKPVTYKPSSSDFSETTPSNYQTMTGDNFPPTGLITDKLLTTYEEMSGTTMSNTLGIESETTGPSTSTQESYFQTSDFTQTTDQEEVTSQSNETVVAFQTTVDENTDESLITSTDDSSLATNDVTEDSAMTTVIEKASTVQFISQVTDDEVSPTLEPVTKQTTISLPKETDFQTWITNDATSSYPPSRSGVTTEDLSTIEFDLTTIPPSSSDPVELSTFWEFLTSVSEYMTSVPFSSTSTSLNKRSTSSQTSEKSDTTVESSSYSKTTATKTTSSELPSSRSTQTSGPETAASSPSTSRTSRTPSTPKEISITTQIHQFTTEQIIQGGGLSVGSIVGIVIGACLAYLLFVCILVKVLLIFEKRKHRKKVAPSSKLSDMESGYDEPPPYEASLPPPILVKEKTVVSIPPRSVTFIKMDGSREESMA